jgi:hypothetical protein
MARQVGDICDYRCAPVKAMLAYSSVRRQRHSWVLLPSMEASVEAQKTVWESKSPAKLVDKKGLNRSSSEKKKTVGERSPWDPHRMGFGPIPRKVLQIPPVNGENRILGEMSCGKTRGASWVGEGGERHNGGDDDVGGVPPPPR